MRILAIETSCDETSACVLDARVDGFHVLSHIVASQAEIHKKYGGIVPEVAARKQMEAIIPVINETLANGDDTYDPSPLDCIAVTQGPGLVTSLRVGVQVAKTLAYVWKKPLVAVNHIEGHVLSALLPQPTETHNSQLIPPQMSETTYGYAFPALALIVSGKHSDLILIKDYGVYELVGRTRDDAAGEAFDKVAKLLDLPYPGGPEISKHAVKGNPAAFDFPRPMIDSDDFDFSFSGLKTAVLYTLRDMLVTKPDSFAIQHSTFKVPPSTLNDLSASFQHAVIDTLVTKTMRAVEKYHVKSVVLGGGVSANKLLRDTLEKHCQLKSLFFHPPSLSYTTDNAAMIAVAGYFKACRGEYADWKTLTADPNLTLV